MNDEGGITSAPGSGETAAMDAQGAAVIMQQARERAGGGGVLLMAAIEPRLHRA